MDWEAVRQQIEPLNKHAMEAATARQQQLLKPEGSLGSLEEISIRMAGITGKVKNFTQKKILFLFGADNGIYQEGIAAAPQSLTHLLMTHYANGSNCGINVICRQNGVDLKLVDMGIIGTIREPLVDNRKLMNGTNNFAKHPAMSREIALQGMEIGFSYAEYAMKNGYDIIGNGEVGMGNTTTAAACIAAVLELADSDVAVGRGAGLSDAAFSRKKQVIREGLLRHAPNPQDPVDIISKVGGLDLAAMTGLYIGAAFYRIPIVVDGVISIAAALLANRFCPLVSSYLFASHASKEPAYQLACDALSLHPILQLGMRLGEGSGCPLAMTVIDTALAVMRDMSTFDEVKSSTAYREDTKVD